MYQMPWVLLCPLEECNLLKPQSSLSKELLFDKTICRNKEIWIQGDHNERFNLFEKLQNSTNNTNSTSLWRGRIVLFRSTHFPTITPSWHGINNFLRHYELTGTFTPPTCFNATAPTSIMCRSTYNTVHVWTNVFSHESEQDTDHTLAMTTPCRFKNVVGIKSFNWLKTSISQISLNISIG